MCPLCATSTALTAAAATTTATSMATLGFDLGRRIIAHLAAIEEWSLRYFESGKRSFHEH